MKLIAIFVDEATGEGLYSIKFDGEKLDEFHRLLSNWSQPENIRNYLKNNEDEYLRTEFFKGRPLDMLSAKTIKEARELSSLFLDIEEQFFAGTLTLQEVFWPLYDTETVFPMHQEVKASIKGWRERKSLLRLYAVRICKNGYVITGGAIKLTGKMEYHPDTLKELGKLKKAKDYLASIDLNNEEDLNLFVL